MLYAQSTSVVISGQMFDKQNANNIHTTVKLKAGITDTTGESSYEVIYKIYKIVEWQLPVTGGCLTF